MASLQPIPSHHRFKDLTGLTFGGTTVLGYAGRGRASMKSLWNCRCKCGNEIVVRSDQLKSGRHRTCNVCFKLRWQKHGLSKTVAGKTWASMIDRCYNKRHKAYHLYGGRGIQVCERWLNSCQAFADDMGNRPSNKHSLDRIDNDGDYTPENCRWATAVEQGNNRNTNVRLAFHGNTLTLTEWAKKLGVNRATFYSRVQRHGVDRAVLMSS